MSSYHTESPKSVFDKLSDELITEILTRIPSKPLCRFKSVSKRFNSIISQPSFLPLYVSRAFSPSWIILDRLPELAPESTHPVRFQLVDCPKISTSAINPSKLTSDLVTDLARSKYPAVILHSSNGLILISLTINRDPHKEREKDPTSFSWRFEQEALYVVNPITSEWIGLPKPIADRTHAGFTARVDPETGVVGRFMVVEYQPVIGSEYGWLLCFVSDTGKWVKKTANYMLDRHFWRSEGAFEFDGKLFWIDLSVGLITWDVKNNDYFKCVENDETAVCRFIPLPKGRLKPFNAPGLQDERWVGGGGGFVQFMEVFKEGHCVLKLWRLKDFEVGGEWSLMYKVSRENVERFLTCDGDCGGGGDGDGSSKMPKPCFVHPFEADVVYFETGDCILSFNLRTQKVGNVDVFTPHQYVFPFVLPKWPSPIPKRLYAACAKEQGNECFKSRDFTEAIECYSKSIDLSPNTATFANRAMAYLKVNKYEEAENDCTESLKLDANYFKVYWRRALARKELGNLKGALEDVELGLKLEPENGEVKKLQAELKSMLEKVSSAGSDSGTEVSACGMDVKAEGN
ncbi:putative F-box/kelch-repeat protein At4g22430 [Silene latifolia]|uniref:putative F-box/kelch-repeat protein At4g22430 n=1 Tax=Silene latifolia TaxID=37657 RepID=UPI003D76CC3D